MGYTDDQIVLPEDGQEIIFTKNKVTYGKKIKLASIYVDQLTGEQVDNFIVLDRQKGQLFRDKKALKLKGPTMPL
jgi:ribonuclease J